MNDEANGDATACECPELDPATWDRVESDWSDATFLASSVMAALGVPVGYYTKRNNLMRKAVEIGATVPEDAMILLGTGRFSRPLLLEVEDPPDGHRDVVRPGGVAWTHLAEAPPGDVRKLLNEFMAESKERYGRDPDDIYLWYLTCRECSAERNFETLFVAHYARP